MDDKSRIGEERRTGGGFFASLKAALKASLERRKAEKEATVIDIGVFILGFLFGARHIAFGAYPLGIALIAILPSRVWLATAGAIAGALTLGKAGIIYSMISLIVVFLRIIISGTDETEENPTDKLFSEPLTLKGSAALIGGFIAAVYEILLSGFNIQSVLFGLSMILLPPLFSVLLSGLFTESVGITSLIYGTVPIFETEGKSKSEKRDIILFQLSVLLVLLLTGLSMEKYTLFGISASFIFSTVVTLFIAKRFGAIRAAVAGFFSCLAVSSSLSVSFALGGAAAGLLFSLGTLPAIFGAGALVCAWGAYSGGIQGLLSVLPEYCLGSSVIYLPLKKVSSQLSVPKAEKAEKTASDMVGTLALSYKNKYSGALDSLEEALKSVSSSIKRYAEESSLPTEDELRELILDCIEGYIGEDSPMPSAEELKKALTKLSLGKMLTEEDFSHIESLKDGAGGLAETVNRAHSILTEHRFKALSSDGTADSFALCSKLINEARYFDKTEKSLDEETAKVIEEVLRSLGTTDSTVAVIGKRRKHIILAATDPTGTAVTSRELKREIEKRAGLKLENPEYYRRGDVALMECSCKERLCCEVAERSAAGDRDGISGDTATSFSTESGCFYALISDGMGSGEDAKMTSEFVSEFMRSALELGTGTESAMLILNGALRKRERESSASLDIFGLDLVSGEAKFVKGGASPSYILRGSSIFRIRSRTAPLGLLNTVDAEIIKAEVLPGDRIVLLSDGVSGASEDPAWLPKLLSVHSSDDPKTLAEAILSSAKKEGEGSDDMTVLVVKVSEL